MKNLLILLFAFTFGVSLNAQCNYSASDWETFINQDADGDGICNFDEIVSGTYSPATSNCYKLSSFRHEMDDVNFELADLFSGGGTAFDFNYSLINIPVNPSLCDANGFGMELESNVPFSANNTGIATLQGLANVVGGYVSGGDIYFSGTQPPETLALFQSGYVTFICWQLVACP